MGGPRGSSRDQGGPGVEAAVLPSCGLHGELTKLIYFLTNIQIGSHINMFVELS